MKVKVLVIDDDRKICDLLKEFLEHRGYDVLTSTSAQDGIEKFIAEKPSIIFLDIIMPEMDGLEALRRIKGIDENVDVVIATGVGDLHIAQRAMSLGAMDYLLKPLDLRHLCKHVLANRVSQHV